MQVGGAPDTVIASCRFTLMNQNAVQLLTALPSIVMIPAAAPNAGKLREFIELIVSELKAPQAGSALTGQPICRT